MMKKIWTLLFGLLISFTGLSQSCLPEGIEFETQDQIDNFQANYPGCTEIEGDMVIITSEWDDITNLSGLSVLTSVGGNLEIFNYSYGPSSDLNSLAGLDGLTEIGGNLLIANNSALTSLAGLDNLVTIGGDLYIGDNMYGGNIRLGNLAGLESLASIGGSLYIINNDSLATLAGLDNLSTIGASLEIGGNPFLLNLSNLGSLSGIGWNLYIDGNSSLASLAGLEGITALGGYLGISGNESLITLSGLDNLISVGYDIYISFNPSLISLTGLDNINPASIIDLSIFENGSLTECSVQSVCGYLASPNGTIHIDNNAPGCENPPDVADDCGISLSCLPHGNYYFDSQSEIDSFPSDYPDCAALEGFVLITGDDITNLYGLSAVTSIEDVLWVVNTTALVNLNGLNEVQYIGGDCLIQGNDALTNLAGLGTLDTVWGRLLINYNDSLRNLSGIYPLKYIGNDFEIRNNGALNSLIALTNLSYIGGYLQISNNNSLMNLMGLDVLGSIGGYLMINSNMQLITLFGLQNLSSIGGALVLNGNNNLTQITPLQNIEAESITDLYIWFNNLLNNCDIESICDYLASPNGTVDIHDNAPGCNSQEEVELACGVGLEESLVDSRQSLVRIYPNPSSATITIEMPTRPANNTTLAIYNVNIRQVISRCITEPQTVLDISMLPPGVYFVRITIEETEIISRVVKM